MELQTNKKPKDEVTFANHIFEFVRFYNNHRIFCDQISGLKGKQVNTGSSEVQVYITEKNFVLAIRKLNAFAIDNLHYIKDLDDAKTLQARIENLENAYYNDLNFRNLANQNLRSAEEETLFQSTYFRYLLQCFEIATTLVYLLQNSLMVASSEVKKYVSYHNPTQFYENLSYYREEVANDLSQFKLDNALNHVKKILGYVYSYKILLKEEEKDLVESLQNKLIAYVVAEKTLENISKAKRTNIDPDDVKVLSEESKKIRNLLQFLYYITNKCLAERNILPKIQRKIFIDKTTI